MISDFFLSEVDNEKKVIRDFGGREVPFDSLVTVPLHTGDPVITKSGLGDEFGFVRADKYTLQSIAGKNIFVLGDAVNYPASLAGSVVDFHYVKLIFRWINWHILLKGKEMPIDTHMNMAGKKID